MIVEDGECAGDVLGSAAGSMQVVAIDWRRLVAFGGNRHAGRGRCLHQADFAGVSPRATTLADKRQTKNRGRKGSVWYPSGVGRGMPSITEPDRPLGSRL